MQRRCVPDLVPCMHRAQYRILRLAPIGMRHPRIQHVTARSQHSHSHSTVTVTQSQHGHSHTVTAPIGMQQTRTPWGACGTGVGLQDTREMARIKPKSRIPGRHRRAWRCRTCPASDRLRRAIGMDQVGGERNRADQRGRQHQRCAWGKDVPRSVAGVAVQRSRGEEGGGGWDRSLSPAELCVRCNTNDLLKVSRSGARTSSTRPDRTYLLQRVDRDDHDHRDHKRCAEETQRQPEALEQQDRDVVDPAGGASVPADWHIEDLLSVPVVPVPAADEGDRGEGHDGMQVKSAGLSGG